VGGHERDQAGAFPLPTLQGFQEVFTVQVRADVHEYLRKEGGLHHAVDGGVGEGGLLVVFVVDLSVELDPRVVLLNGQGEERGDKKPVQEGFRWDVLGGCALGVRLDQFGDDLHVPAEGRRHPLWFVTDGGGFHDGLRQERRDTGAHDDLRVVLLQGGDL